MIVQMKIDLHFAGIFTRYLVITYSDGAEQRFEDVDFARMDKNDFVLFVEIFSTERCVNVYYCMPDIKFPNGLRIIANDSNYMDFIEIGYACGYVVPVYIDHLGVYLPE